MNTNTVTQQRQQRRVEEQRAAEWANDLASACEWLADQVGHLAANTEAKRMIVGTTLAELDKMRTTAKANADRHLERAAAINDSIAAAARPQPNRGGAL